MRTLFVTGLWAWLCLVTTGTVDAATADTGEHVTAVWKSQLLLPRLSVQVIKDNVRCSSSFDSVGPPRLTVSALVPAG